MKENKFLWAAGKYISKKLHARKSEKVKTSSIDQGPSPSEGDLREGVWPTTSKTSEKNKDTMVLHLPYVVRQACERVGV